MAQASVPLTNWSPDKTHTDPKRWICIYPAYINSKKSRQEGRRIPKEHCVENPSYQEIRDVLTVERFPVSVENKLYSRERSKELSFRGRVRVQLKNDDGTPVNERFPTRDSLLLHLGDTIPQLKTRHGGRAAPAETSGSSVQQAGGSGGSHKKGKGKRR